MSAPKHIKAGIPIQNIIPDGGPAFPVTNWSASGMTLRDYFAAAAFPEMYRSSHGNDYAIAHGCYELADAMLRAREAKP